MKKLSVAIITLNEERNIGRCLESLHSLADEIVVLDSLSTDRTESICRDFGARFERQPFAGHIRQKQDAIDLCSYEMVLSLDADEALSDELRNVILKEKQKDFPSFFYSMNRLTNYCGKWIYHCGWYPDTKLRLFDRRYALMGGQNPHDKIIPTDSSLSVDHLQGDLLHYSYYNIEEHRQQANRFATIAAKAMASKGKNPSFAFAVFKAVAKFIRNYILKLGFLDGRYGWVICRISAWETYQKYRRVGLFQSKKSP